MFKCPSCYYSVSLSHSLVLLLTQRPCQQQKKPTVGVFVGGLGGGVAHLEDDVWRLERTEHGRKMGM